MKIIILILIIAKISTVVYGFGRNAKGQLGVEGKKYKPAVIDFWNGKVIKKIEIGRKHSLVLTSNDELYGSGLNKAGQLGIGNYKNQVTPVLIKELSRVGVEDISCGESHSVVLLKNGTVYTFGNNTDGQLGHGTVKWANKPTIVRGLNHEKIKFIGGGRSFSTAVTQDGRIYTWGSNSHGELGIGRFSNETEIFTNPQLVKNFNRITKLVTGKRQVIAQIDNRVLYSWGGGKYGELMHGNIKNVSYPKLIKFTGDEKAIHFSIGYGHTAIVTTKNMYLAGKNNFGQIGINSTRSSIKVPTELKFFRGKIIKSIQCGHHQTYVLIQENERNLFYVFGDHRNGELGLGKTGIAKYRVPILNRFIPTNVTVMPTKSFHLDDMLVY